LTGRTAASDWEPDDYDVFDGERDVGRIFRINAAPEVWWWGVGFQLTGRKSHGTADSLDAPRQPSRRNTSDGSESGHEGACGGAAPTTLRLGGWARDRDRVPFGGKGSSNLYPLLATQYCTKGQFARHQSRRRAPAVLTDRHLIFSDRASDSRRFIRRLVDDANQLRGRAFQVPR
jgi:hypothetical protein